MKNSCFFFLFVYVRKMKKLLLSLEHVFIALRTDRKFIILIIIAADIIINHDVKKSKTIIYDILYHIYLKQKAKTNILFLPEARRHMRFRRCWCKPNGGSVLFTLAIEWTESMKANRNAHTTHHTRGINKHSRAARVNSPNNNIIIKRHYNCL